MGALFAWFVQRLGGNHFSKAGRVDPKTERTKARVRSRGGDPILAGRRLALCGEIGAGPGACDYLVGSQLSQEPTGQRGGMGRLNRRPLSEHCLDAVTLGMVIWQRLPTNWQEYVGERAGDLEATGAGEAEQGQ
jgi:hypothetical protein